jgi:23S rRNA pseudouridine2605 synthase
LDEEIRRLEQGVKLEDGMTSPAHVKKVRKAEQNSWLELTIREGRKHQVKRMLESVGHPVIKLVRVRMGPLSLDNLEPGEYRFLTDREANALRELVEERMAAVERGALPTQRTTRVRRAGWAKPARAKKHQPKKASVV